MFRGRIVGGFAFSGPALLSFGEEAGLLKPVLVLDDERAAVLCGRVISGVIGGSAFSGPPAFLEFPSGGPVPVGEEAGVLEPALVLRVGCDSPVDHVVLRRQPAPSISVRELSKVQDYLLVISGSAFSGPPACLEFGEEAGVLEPALFLRVGLLARIAQDVQLDAIVAFERVAAAYSWSCYVRQLSEPALETVGFCRYRFIPCRLETARVLQDDLSLDRVVAQQPERVVCGPDRAQGFSPRWRARLCARLGWVGLGSLRC